MYEKDGIVYADKPRSELKIIEVETLPDYYLKVQFSSGKEKLCDFKPLLDKPAFMPLKDKAVFDNVTLEHGVPEWCDGNIDIAPEWIYAHSVNQN